MRRAATLALITLLAGFTQNPAQAQPDFYKGKTVSIVCGYGVGGGYDLYARTLARHLGDHIPGKPTVVVQNMTGAGGMRAANAVYSTLPKDGTAIACTNPIVLMYQLMGGAQARYETGKLQWIGSLDEPNNAIIALASSGLRTIDDAKQREVPVPGDGPTSSMSLYPTATNALLGTRFRVIDGYTGSAAGDLAMQRGEVDARSGATLGSLFAQYGDAIHEGKLNVLIQFGPQRSPRLPAVPLLQDLVTTARDKQIAEILGLPATIGPGYWMAPDVPDERIATLRKAFEATATDPAFLASAKQVRLDLTPRTGAAVQRAVDAVAAYPKDVLAQTAKILRW
jgi:tripartite-type tricarboxylate transporter receptor subunit TctC